MKHTTQMEWPNGEGFTPCTPEYLLVRDEMAELLPPGRNLDDLSPADYQRYCELDNRALNMQADGHLGKGERY